MTSILVLPALLAAQWMRASLLHSRAPQLCCSASTLLIVFAVLLACPCSCAGALWRWCEPLGLHGHDVPHALKDVERTAGQVCDAYVAAALLA
jgi:hypothetical protein